MKKVLLFTLIFISIFTKSAFTEFEASIYVPLGITSTFPNIVDPKRNFVRNIYLNTTESDISFNIGVNGNFGYRFNINENNAISILTEIGYSRLDFASRFKAQTDNNYGNNKIYNASQNLVFHTLNIGLMPKYAVNLTSLLKNINPNYEGKMELNIGIGFVDVNTLNEIKNEIEIIQEIEFDELKEGIATLKKNMLNKATLELIKEIKQYYAQ